MEWTLHAYHYLTWHILVLTKSSSLHIHPENQLTCMAQAFLNDQHSTLIVDLQHGSKWTIGTWLPWILEICSSQVLPIKQLKSLVEEMNTESWWIKPNRILFKIRYLWIEYPNNWFCLFVHCQYFSFCYFFRNSIECKKGYKQTVKLDVCRAKDHKNISFFHTHINLFIILNVIVAVLRNYSIRWNILFHAVWFLLCISAV